MLMLIYTIVAMAITPIAYEFVNSRITANGKIANIVKGWPAYVINVIVCGVVALVAMLLPGGWEANPWNWIVLTALIYFGNQFVYNLFIKWLFRNENV